MSIHDLPDDVAAFLSAIAGGEAWAAMEDDAAELLVKHKRDLSSRHEPDPHFNPEHHQIRKEAWIEARKELDKMDEILAEQTSEVDRLAQALAGTDPLISCSHCSCDPPECGHCDFDARQHAHAQDCIYMWSLERGKASEAQ